MNLRFFTAVFAAALFCSCVFVDVSHAYLDPGAGSAILQGILAAIVALAITLKLYWHKLLKLLGLRKDSSRPSEKTPDKHTNAER